MRANSFGALLILLAVIGVPILGQGAGLGMFPARIPASEAAATIWEAHKDQILACDIDLKRSDDRVASALVAIEAYTTPGLERLAENTGLSVLARLGLPVPDWSVGLAQIRPSTGGPLAPEWNTRDLAVQMASDDCLSVQLSVRIVRQLARKWGGNACDADCLLSVARSYNGQQSVNGANLAYLGIFNATLKHVEKEASLVR